MGIATSIEGGVAGIVARYTTDVSASFSEALVPIALSMGTIYIMLMGWAIARGEVNFSASDFSWRMFKMACICAIALGGGTYQQFVVDGLGGIEGMFTETLTGGEATSIGALIDKNIVPVETLTGELMKLSNESVFPNMSLLTAAVLCTLGQFFITLCSLVPLLIAKVTTAVLLAVGPVFVLMSLWPATKRFTEAWLTALLEATMTVCIVAGLAGFLPVFINKYATELLKDLTSSNPLQNAIGLAITIFCLGYLTWHSGAIGAKLVGGTSLGNPAGSIARGVMKFFSPKSESPPPPPPHQQPQVPNTIGDGSSGGKANRNVIENLHR